MSNKVYFEKRVHYAIPIEEVMAFVDPDGDLDFTEAEAAERYARAVQSGDLPTPGLLQMTDALFLRAPEPLHSQERLDVGQG